MKWLTPKESEYLVIKSSRGATSLSQYEEHIFVKFKPKGHLPSTCDRYNGIGQLLKTIEVGRW